jgi:hypothetical protein
LLTPKGDAIRLRQAIGRKFNNAGASVCHECLTLMIRELSSNAAVPVLTTTASLPELILPPPIR